MLFCHSAIVCPELLCWRQMWKSNSSEPAGVSLCNADCSCYSQPHGVVLRLRTNLVNIFSPIIFFPCCVFFKLTNKKKTNDGFAPPMWKIHPDMADLKLHKLFPGSKCGDSWWLSELLRRTLCWLGQRQGLTSATFSMKMMCVWSPSSAWPVAQDWLGHFLPFKNVFLSFVLAMGIFNHDWYYELDKQTWRLTTDPCVLNFKWAGQKIDAVFWWATSSEEIILR